MSTTFNVCRECGHRLGKKAEFCHRHPKATVDTVMNWASTPNGARSRPMVTVTMSPWGLAELDRMRGETSRGVYIEELLAEKARERVPT